MDNIPLVQVVDRIEDLADRLRRILLRELAILADPVEQLAAGGQLSDNVKFVLPQCEYRRQ